MSQTAILFMLQHKRESWLADKRKISFFCTDTKKLWKLTAIFFRVVVIFIFGSIISVLTAVSAVPCLMKHERHLQHNLLHRPAKEYKNLKRMISREREMNADVIKVSREGITKGGNPHSYLPLNSKYNGKMLGLQHGSRRRCQTWCQKKRSLSNAAHTDLLSWSI